VGGKKTRRDPSPESEEETGPRRRLNKKQRRAVEEEEEEIDELQSQDEGEGNGDDDEDLRMPEEELAALEKHDMASLPKRTAAIRQERNRPTPNESDSEISSDEEEPNAEGAQYWPRTDLKNLGADPAKWYNLADVSKVFKGTGNSYRHTNQDEEPEAVPGREWRWVDATDTKPGHWQLYLTRREGSDEAICIVDIMGPPKLAKTVSMHFLFISYLHRANVTFLEMDVQEQQVRRRPAWQCGPSLDVPGSVSLPFPAICRL
jgi:hypothetical protein